MNIRTEEGIAPDLEHVNSAFNAARKEGCV